MHQIVLGLLLHAAMTHGRSRPKYSLVVIDHRSLLLAETHEELSETFSGEVPGLGRQGCMLLRASLLAKHGSQSFFHQLRGLRKGKI